MKRATTSKLAAIAALGGIMASANADIAYNSFGANDTYDIYGRTIGDGQNANDTGQGIAMNFTSATSGAVSIVKLALSAYLYKVSINLDHNGLPGKALETWDDVGGGGIAALAGDGSAVLTTGQSYWMCVQGEQNEANPYGIWYYGVLDGEYSVNYNGGAWGQATNNVETAYRVETQAVPETSTAVALGFAGAALVARKRRK